MVALVGTRDLYEIIDDWNKLIQIRLLLRAHRPLIEAKPTVIKAQVERQSKLAELLLPACAFEVYYAVFIVGVIVITYLFFCIIQAYTSRFLLTSYANCTNKVAVIYTT